MWHSSQLSLQLPVIREVVWAKSQTHQSHIPPSVLFQLPVLCVELGHHLFSPVPLFMPKWVQDRPIQGLLENPLSTLSVGYFQQKTAHPQSYVYYNKAISLCALWSQWCARLLLSKAFCAWWCVAASNQNITQKCPHLVFNWNLCSKSNTQNQDLT